MAKIQIGKVVPTYAGEWKQSTPYGAQTVVVYSGSSYISLRDLTGVLTGAVPMDDGVNWRLMAAKGQKGDRGTDGTVSFGSLTAAQKQELKGAKGDNGFYFTPSVDTEGNLSWRNNGSLTNPSTVNIRGPKGDTGNPGSTFALHVGKNDDGEDGHLMMEVFDTSFRDLLYLGEDGHLYVRTSDDMQ